MKATALIAEDEPKLAAALRAELRLAWPQLDIVAVEENGRAAVRRTRELRPNVVFLDIRMPVLGGLEAAAELAGDWPLRERFPLLVFVTAYQQFAVRAFDQHAVDYVLKPVEPRRLSNTVKSLKRLLQDQRRADESEFERTGQFDLMAEKIRALLDASSALARPTLTVLACNVGSAVHMVKLEDVLYFETCEHYVRVVTRERDYLIRTPLRTLVSQLRADMFWQIHRGTVVRASAVSVVLRTDTGKVFVEIDGCEERLLVSRLYANRFKAL